MVERNRLIELAPQYYQLAICAFFAGRPKGVASSTTLWGERGMEHGPTFWRALEVLVDKGMLKVIKDDFGPNIYTKGDPFNAEWTAMKKQPDTPAFKYDFDPEGAAWLLAALGSVNKALKDLNIQVTDFTEPDAEWEPLPVERTNPQLQKLTEELEKTIQAAESDNGYAANLPEEKAFVVENLKNTVEKLTTGDSVSFAYLKQKAINTLDILIRRFGPASLGLAAQAARAALFDWLKEIGAKALRWII